MSSVLAQHDVVASAASSGTEARAAERLLARPVSIDVSEMPLKQAINRVAADAKVMINYQAQIVDAYAKRVTVRLKSVPLGRALDQLLAGTTLRVIPDGTTQLVIVDGRDGSTTATGVITGTVLDAKTKRPVSGAKVTLDDAKKGIFSGEDGTFRIAGVTAGSHVVHIRIIGYEKTTTSTTVVDGETARVEVTLTPSANVLDQVVVTGTVVATSLKAVPSAITVITAKELEQRNITNIAQLFRGDVPGLFASFHGEPTYNNGPGREIVSSRGNSTLNGAIDSVKFIKTYVDGVELANSQYIGLIDPRTIERIEILTGPQASTIYGSNAINGVMQIFTKRGSTSRPQLIASFQGGWTPAVGSSALAPKYNTNAQLSGVEGHVSYSAGLSWDYTGSWSPSVNLRTLSGTGGAHFQRGPVAADYTVARTNSRNQDQGGTGQQVLTTLIEKGEARVDPRVGYPRLTASTDVRQGGTFTYTPITWWSHTLTVGNDELKEENDRFFASYAGTYDTVGSFHVINQTRQTFGYNTAVRIPATSYAVATVTAGMDGWHSSGQDVFGNPPVRGFVSQSYVSVGRGHSRGGFLQGQLGVWDALFLTYGLRSEWNPDYGTDANPNLAPRYGAALSHEFGEITAKLRGSYGRSTRPPSGGLRRSLTLLEAGNVWDAYAFGGGTISQFENLDLLPESKQGGEGGVELYFGSRASLVVTRYNETVNNLITNTIVDSVLRLDGDTDPNHFCGIVPQLCGLNSHFKQSENLNLGSVRNQGWELQGTVTLGPVTTRGTYSWTKSRLIGITPRYRAQFPQYTVGAPFDYSPEHTYAIDVTYAHGGTTLSTNWQGLGQLGGVNSLVMDQLVGFGTRLSAQYAPRYQDSPGFHPVTAGYVVGDANLQQRVTSYLDVEAHLTNIRSVRQNDYSATAGSPGRTTILALRLRY